LEPRRQKRRPHFSNGDLTFTTNNTNASVRAIASASSGKKYWEVHTDIMAGAPSGTTNGFANASYPLEGNFVGGDNNSIGWAGDGTVWRNVSVIGTAATWVLGDWLGIAVDFTAQKIWCRVGAGNWNNDVPANQDPATGTGGFSFAALAAGPYFACSMAKNAGDATTANFGATARTEPSPTAPQSLTLTRSGSVRLVVDPVASNPQMLKTVLIRN
jgi:hypothetical protein